MRNCCRRVKQVPYEDYELEKLGLMLPHLTKVGGQIRGKQ